MNDEPLSLPGVYEALLDPETLDALFEDLESEVGPVEITLKGSARAYADVDTDITLREAKRAVTRGEARGAQIRYVYEGQLYCDTLLRTPRGIRLIRMAQPTAPDALSP